jgi:hypothetical protein
VLTSLLGEWNRPVMLVAWLAALTIFMLFAEAGTREVNGRFNHSHALSDQYVAVWVQ